MATPLWLAKQQPWRFPRLSGQLLLPSFFRLLPGVRSFSKDTLPTSLTPQKLPPPPPLQTSGQAHFMVDYLVSKCGLFETDAVKASKRLAHLKSPEKPDAVLRLLTESGLCEAHITRLVRRAPSLLLADAKKTLEPKIRALEEAGFSKPELAELVSLNPNALALRNAVPRIDFWRKMVGSNEKFLKVARNIHLLGFKVQGKVNNNLSFLRSVGMSDADIARLVVRRPRFLAAKLNKVESIVEQVKSLGVTPGSGPFLEALSTVVNLSQTTLEAKCKLLRSFGWSGDELLYAFQSFPVMLRLSEKRITRAMDFLVKEAGYEPSYVAQRPVLLGYSIDKRLIPRYYVLQFLKKKGLPGGGSDLLGAVVMRDEKFIGKFIAPVRENVPELLETYPEVSEIRNAMTG